MKVVILGGRSGTSVMHRILRESGFIVWGHTEPPGIQDTILDNLYNRPAIIEALEPLKDYDLAKCPEFAFCWREIVAMYPESRFIWMDRPLVDRVESHTYLGWDQDISEKIQGNEDLEETIRHILGWAAVNGNTEFNDMLFFRIMDHFNTSLQAHHPKKVLRIHYEDFNRYFHYTMQMVADFLDIETNFPAWQKVKNKKQQAGRWELK